jgi:hypothetical protein
VSVTLRGRPFDEVLRDMVEGVLRVNELDAPAVARWEPVLLDAATGHGPTPGRLPSAAARMAERQTQAA